MDTHDAASRPFDLTRREILRGGLLVGGVMLAGCASQNAGLPGPRYPFEGGAGPELARTKQPVPAPTLPIPAPTPSLEVPTGVISRSQWTRSGVARPRDTNPMNGITRITVHHDAIVSSDLYSSADVARRIESIRRSHVQRGWADIGYHYVVDPQGRIWEGRSTALQGAHVEFNNEHNLGVVVLGNFIVQSPTSAATTSLDRFVAQQMQRYRVPISRVYTHQELRPTACPGTNLQRFMVATRGRAGTLYAMSV